MFTRIVLRDLGVIEHATLELGPGLNVLTGETGAGKTMVVSGLGLLLGDRGDSSLVRRGSDAAVVEGLLALPGSHPVLERVAEAGGTHDDGELVLVRTVNASGRSRAHVGGRAAPIGVLTDLREHLVAVHGQADQWRLRQAEAHRVVLDDFAGEPVLRLRTEVGAAHERWRGLREEHEALVRSARERARRVDALTAALEEIERVDPQPGEDESLRAEEDRLAHVDELRRCLAEAALALTGDDDAAESGLDARGLIGQAARALEHTPGNDPAVRDLAARVHELLGVVTDLGADLHGLLGDVEADPARLEHVQQRRADLGVLTRKYGDTVTEVLDWSRESAGELDTLVRADERVTTMGAEVERARIELAALVARLHDARVEAGADFGQRVAEELRHLSMGRATLEVQVTSRTEVGGIEMLDGSHVRVAAHGGDDVEIVLAANPGSTPRSVARAASGGELSRVMLAIEVVGASSPGATAGAASATPPTFVFDEVDAGVGGAAALDVGARLARLAEHAQVIVVTHLAQVAAFADTHLVVHKDTDGSVTASSVTRVDGEERLRELSRMMSGDPDSVTGLEHARTLVETATRRGTMAS